MRNTEYSIQIFQPKPSHFKECDTNTVSEHLEENSNGLEHRFAYGFKRHEQY